MTGLGAYAVGRGGARQSGGGPVAGVGAEPGVAVMVAAAGEAWKLRAIDEGAGRRGSLEAAGGGAPAASPLLLMFCRGRKPTDRSTKVRTSLKDTEKTPSVLFI